MSFNKRLSTKLGVRTFCLLAGLVACGGAGITAAAAEWPKWRGPTRDGVSKETGLLKEWPEDGPPLAWTAKGIGQGYASVSLAGGKLFTMGEDGSSSYVRALDPKTG